MIWIKRILVMIVTVFFAMTLTFILIRIMPGDPVETLAMDMVRTQGMNFEEAYKQAQAALNYDPETPILEQYMSFVRGLATLNFGNSMIYKKPVMHIIGGSLPWTIFLLSISTFLAFMLGIIIGMYVAWKRKTIIDPIMSVYASIMSSIANYIVSLLLILIFAGGRIVLPSRGAYDSTVEPGFNWKFFANVFKHSILPVGAFFLTTVGNWALAMKGNAISVLGEDYVNAARARGLGQRRIIFSYVGRNALLPLVTNLAITFGMMFGGSPLIENIFAYPGIGYFLNQSIGRRDFMLMQGMFLTITVAVVISNFLADILNSVLDPRLRS